MAKMNETTVKTSSGAKIDSVAADALAVEAEHGYDLSASGRRRVGRPSLGPTGSSPRVSFRATPELYQAAKHRATKEGRTISDLAREAVDRYVNSSPGQPRTRQDDHPTGNKSVQSRTGKGG